MNNSVLENWSDKVIFSMIKELKKIIDLDNLENSGDYTFFNAVESIGRFFSFDPNYVDCDYLYNIWKLNEDLFDDKKLESNLKRPVLKNYTVDSRIRKSIIVDEYWTNSVSLYTERNDVENLLWELNSNGDISIYDGDMYNEETLDSEWVEDEITDITEN